MSSPSRSIISGISSPKIPDWGTDNVPFGEQGKSPFAQLPERGCCKGGLPEMPWRRHPPGRPVYAGGPGVLCRGCGRIPQAAIRLATAMCRGNGPGEKNRLVPGARAGETVAAGPGKKTRLRQCGSFSTCPGRIRSPVRPLSAWISAYRVPFPSSRLAIFHRESPGCTSYIRSACADGGEDGAFSVR